MGVCVGGVGVDTSSSEITFRSSCLLTLDKEVTQCYQFKAVKIPFSLCFVLGLGVFLVGGDWGFLLVSLFCFRGLVFVGFF